MKTNGFISAMLLAAAAVCASCTKAQPAPGPVAPEFTSPVLTLSKIADGIVFEWTAACNDASEKVDYDVYYGPESIDLFTNGEKISAGSALKATVSAEDLTTVLLEKFSCKYGSDVNIQALVYAKAKEKKTSNVAKITFHIESANPESLFITGGVIDDEWIKRVELSKVSEGVYEATDVEFRLGKPDDGKGFKIFLDAESWYPYYGQKTGAAFGALDIFNESDPDSQIYPLASGYTTGKYTVNVNLNTLVLTLTRTGDIQEFDPDKAMFIVGPAIDDPWNFKEVNALLPVSEGVYEIASVHLSKDGGFKFSANNWAPQYIKNLSAGDDYTAKLRVDDKEDNYFEVAVSGKYKVNFNTTTLKVLLTLLEADPVVDCIYMFGPATEAGWEESKFIEMPKTADGVYSATVAINVGEAVEGDPKGNGFKFAKTRGWDQQYGAKENFEDGYRGWELGDVTRDALQFYPLLMGKASGTYTVVVDFNTKTVSLN